MNKQKLLFGLLIVVIAGISVMAGFKRIIVQHQDKPSGDVPPKVIREKGLREGARLKGHFVTQTDPSWDWAAFDLEALTKNSIAIIIGQADEGKGQLKERGDILTTNYPVTVIEPLKGNFRQGNTIQVAMVGGKVEFEDGTSVEVKTPGFERMSKGKRYLLFLTAHRNGSPVLILTGGPQGLFDINEERIKAFATPTDVVSKEVFGKQSNDIVQKVRDYASKWPNAQVCWR